MRPKGSSGVGKISEYFNRSDVRASFWLVVRCFEAECTKCCKWLFLPEEADVQLCPVVLSLCVETAPLVSPPPLPSCPPSLLCTV